MSRRALVVLASLGVVGCSAERKVSERETTPQRVVVAQQPQKPQVRVSVEQKGWKQWQAQQEREKQLRTQQVAKARADQAEAIRRAEQARLRADAAAREAALAGNDRERAQWQAQKARQEAEQAQAALSARQQELTAAEQAQQQYAAELEKARAELDAQRTELEQREQALQQEQQARAAAEQRARSALEQVATVKEEARGLVVTLNGSVLFAFDDASLLPSAQKRLDVVADVLKQAPDQTFTVEGHTDAVGEDHYNLELSQRRAQSVRDYLVSKGVDNSQIKANGYGELRPVADNASAEGRANNRRVEIVLPKSTTGIGGSGAQTGQPVEAE